jgi:hypothetical protein
MAWFSRAGWHSGEGLAGFLLPLGLTTRGRIGVLALDPVGDREGRPAATPANRPTVPGSGYRPTSSERAFIGEALMASM